uniref:Uncharacterized protein n=1 Tax=Romanomermis culicivorax TaxID=13658 RepID=A0A915HPA7_ROMCU
MDSAFSKHMMKCIILDDDSNDQCIISTYFLAHPNIHAIPNSKDDYIKIQDVKLSFKVIAVQWETDMVFPLTSALIPNLIIQPLTNQQVPTEFLVETAIVNITDGMCPLLFINNRPNSIKLGPNQPIIVAKQTSESIPVSNNISMAVAASDHNITDQEPAGLDKSLLHHTDK